MSSHHAFRRTGVAASALLCVLTVRPSAPHAQTTPTFRQLLSQAEAAAPRLAEQGFNVTAAEARARQANVRPNPTVSLDVENVLGTGPLSGVDRAEVTVSASQSLELGGRRSARTAAARAEIDAARARSVQARADFGRDIALAYVEAETSGARVGLAVQQLELAAADLRTARILVDAGREPQLRAIQAQAEADDARAELAAAEAEQSRALSQLTALAAAPAPIATVGSELLVLAETLPIPTLPEFEGTPAVLSALAEREAAAARVRVERTLGRPDLTVAAGVRRSQEDDAFALVAGVSAQLPLFDRNRGATAAALAELNAAEARLAQARLQAEADARGSVAAARGAASRLDAARRGEAAAEEAYRVTRIGYEAGRLSQLELTTARRSLVAARSRTVDARLARLQAEIEAARVGARIPFGDQ